MLLNGNFCENVGCKCYHQKPETNPKSWNVIKKYSALVECYKSLKRICKKFFKTNVFENVD